MKGNRKEGSGGRTPSAKELSRNSLAKAKELLPPMLQDMLHHAKVSDVTALVLKQLGWGLLSEACWQKRIEEAGQEPVDWDARCDQVAGEACASALRSQYVTDCDRIARLFDIRTSSEEQGEIVRFYRKRYESWVRELIKEMLRARVGCHLASGRVDDAFARVEEPLFGFDAFVTHARTYAPVKRRTFGGYFKWRAIRRCVDATHAEWRKGIVMEFDDGCEVAEESEDLERTARLIAWLWKRLEDLGRIQSRRNPHLGRELRAVVELRLKSYLDPDDMAPWTRNRVGTSGWKTIVDEYRQSQVELKELVENTLSKAQSRYREGYAMARFREGQLGEIPEAQLHHLRARALGRDLGELERELEGVQAGRGRGHSAEELEYMLAWARFERARWRYEEVRAQWERWCQLKLPWIRAEAAIGRLLGLSQPTVFRRLTEGWEELRKMGALPRDDEDESEEDQKCQGQERGGESAKGRKTRRDEKERGKEQEDQRRNDEGEDPT